MGVNTVIITEYAIDNLDDIPKRLKSCNELFIKNHKILKKHWTASINPVKNYLLNHIKIRPSLKWKWIQPPVGKLFPELDGPLGFDLYFNGVNCKNLYTISIAPRWSIFVDDTETQETIIECVKCIIKSLGGNKAIFVPDSYYCASIAADEYPEMNSLKDVEKFLLSKCGHPKSKLSEICRALSDKEMHASNIDWNGDEGSRLFDYDGYFILEIS